ncbi:MAG: DUF3329 domain-containing protein [Oricola sp.]
MKKFFDFNDPFYKPLWLRVAIVAAAGGWGLFELVAGSPFWGMIFLGMGAAAFHGLFIKFAPRESREEKQREE